MHHMFNVILLLIERCPKQTEIGIAICVDVLLHYGIVKKGIITEYFQIN